MGNATIEYDGKVTGVASNGLHFAGYYDVETGLIRNFYPVLE
jgi:hypothetical protein